MVETIAPAFAGAIDPAAPLTRLWTGARWLEGPAWLAKEQRLVFSDIPGNRLLAWSAATGETTSFRAPSRGGNGNSVDREGRLVTCEQYARQITRTETDGSVTVLAADFAGRRFNAPNDIVVKADGSVWFTDPDYGRSEHYEGAREMAGCHVYRIDPASGAVRQMTDDFVMPNGLAFSPDESRLYIIDTGSTHLEGGPNHLREFAVAEDGALSGGAVLASNAAKMFDGFRVDVAGNLWMGAEDGVHVYAPDGEMIGRVKVPERVSNLAFGGADRQLLLMTATTSLYALPVRVRPAV